MVKFTKYWETMIAHKPEWRRAYVDYKSINKMIKRLKQEVKAREQGTQREYDVYPRGAEVRQSATETGRDDDDDDVEEADEAIRHALRSPVAPRGTNTFGSISRVASGYFDGGPGPGTGGSLNSDGAGAVDDPLLPPKPRPAEQASPTRPPASTARRVSSAARPVQLASTPPSPGQGPSASSSSRPGQHAADESEQQLLTAAAWRPVTGPFAGQPSAMSSPSSYQELPPTATGDLPSPPQRQESGLALKMPRANRKPPRESTLQAPGAARDAGARDAGARDAGLASPAPLTPEPLSVAVESPPISPRAHDPEQAPPQLTLSREPSISLGAQAAGAAVPSTPQAGPAEAKLEYVLTLHGRELALEIEDLMIAEVAKCVRWCRKAIKTFDDYIAAHRDEWPSAKNIKKAKFAVRHVYEDIHYLHIFCDTNVLAIKTALKKYYHSQPEGMTERVSEETLLPDLHVLTGDVEATRRDLELFYSKHFSDGDVRSGIAKLRNSVGTPIVTLSQAFRAGMFTAALLAIILYWFHVYYELEPGPHLTSRFDEAFPVFRLFCSITFSFVCWSWVLRVFAVQRINYLYVFEFPQTTTISWLRCYEYGMFLLCLVLLGGILHLRLNITALPYEDERTNDYNTAVHYVMPVVIFIVILAIAYPPIHVVRNTRAAFFDVFSRIVKLPWGYVRFVEFFVADWGTSFPMPAADIVFFVCWYTGAAKYAFGDVAGWHDCKYVSAHYQFPVAALPYFWRACQTLKMYLRTNNRAHLVNHGKYQSFMVYFISSWVSAFFPETPTKRFFHELFHFVAELYALIWDVLMDWGFIRGRERERMFKRTWIYVAAALFDTFARFFYLPAEYLKKSPHVSAEWLYLFQCLLEIFRRANWSIFRVENENVNNLETYRSIDFVPEVTLPENVK